ncbi:MAG: DoxX family protein [Chloroflexia bacterium]
MSTDLALLILRLSVGLILAAHGAQKLLGWFGGSGVAGTAKGFAGMGFRPAGFWAVLAGVSEFGGGLALALGFLSPLGSLGVIAAMLMAIIVAHWPRFFSSQRGMEFPLLLLIGGLAVGISGPGSYSLDALLGLALPEPITLVGGLALVLIGVVIGLATRAPRAAATDQPASTQARS